MFPGPGLLVVTAQIRVGPLLHIRVLWGCWSSGVAWHHHKFQASQVALVAVGGQPSWPGPICTPGAGAVELNPIESVYSL